MSAALDLFDAPPPVPASGDVPRTVAPGVVWDLAAEARYVAIVNDMTTRGLMGYGYRLEDACRSSRWAVEADLHRGCIRRELEAAGRAFEPEDKRALFARWKAEYGEARANELAGLQRSSIRSKILKEW